MFSSSPACHPERSEGSAFALGSVALVLLAIFGLMFGLGCAVPGEPLPPLLEIPAPVSSLAAQQVGSQLQIKFAVPQLTTEGTRPQRMERIELFVVYTASSEPQPGLVTTPEKVWTSVEFSNGAGELLYAVPLTASQVGRRAWLAVRAANNRNMDAGLSNVVAVDIANLPETPTSLSAIVSEHAIEITWRPSSRSVFGDSRALSGEVQYEIFRGLSGSAEAMQSIGRSNTPSFTDSAIALGSTYSYAVRAFVPLEGSVAVTPLSSAVEIAAIDRFAPAAPANLRAISVTGAVELAWSPNSEADLAGYNIYREQLADDGSSGPRVKLNPALLDIPLFRDATAGAQNRYRFVVTALDRDGNESPPSNEETVETE